MSQWNECRSVPNQPISRNTHDVPNRNNVDVLSGTVRIQQESGDGPAGVRWWPIVAASIGHLRCPIGHLWCHICVIMMSPELSPKPTQLAKKFKQFQCKAANFRRSLEDQKVLLNEASDLLVRWTQFRRIQKATGLSFRRNLLSAPSKLTFLKALRKGLILLIGPSKFQTMGRVDDITSTVLHTTILLSHFGFRRQSEGKSSLVRPVKTFENFGKALGFGGQLCDA